MTLHRRTLMIRSAQAAAVAAMGVGLSGCADDADRASTPSPSQARASKDSPAETTFLLVHGAWHTAHHWNRVLLALTALGHRAVAIDLPGAGLEARFPRAYLAQDTAAMRTERSPLAGYGLERYVDPTVALVRQLASHGKVVLVGHSFGGLTVTRAADVVPDLVRRVVYLTAYCPVRLGSASEYNALPENAPSLSGTIGIGDPQTTGAIRINPRSDDPHYVEQCRQAFYNDLPLEDFLPYAAGLVPDLPLRAATDGARGSLERWGKVPRTFIRCTRDHAILPSLQDRMIKEADAATPGNTFDVKSLDTSHSAFASRPEEVARLLGDLA